MLHFPNIKDRICVFIFCDDNEFIEILFYFQKFTTCVKSSVNAIQMMGEKTILVSTTNCEIFVIDKKTFKANLVVTCHTSTIYHVNFP